jgi:hypothetical protein
MALNEQVQLRVVCKGQAAPALKYSSTGAFRIHLGPLLSMFTLDPSFCIHFKLVPRIDLQRAWYHVIGILPYLDISSPMGILLLYSE